MTSPTRFYESTLDRFGRLVHAVGPDDWDRPTPCAGWTVRDLVGHVTSEQLWAPPLLAGQTIDEVGDRFAGDVLGADPGATWDRAAADARAAFAEPDALERTVALSYGPELAAEYAFQMTFDLLIHAWDLGVAIGERADGPDPTLVHDAVTALEPQLAGWRRAGLFGPAVEVPPRSGEWARLLGLTGRDPAWQPPSVR